jgi:hypothetical protein
MKRIPIETTAALCAALTLSVHADLTGTFKTITLDGSLADWSNPGDVLYDATEIGAGAPAASSYDDIYLANNATDLFIGLDTSGPGGGSVSNTWTRNIYLDTDTDGATGFNAGWMANGYDRLVQYGASGGSYSVFEFTGTSQSDWSWNWLGLVSYSYNDDIAEISVPLSSLGVSGNSFVAEFNVTGGDATTETWASQYESNAETYTIAAIPEPATLGMMAMFGGAIMLIRRKLAI